MSRAHMLYDDTPMSAVPVKIFKCKGNWNPDTVFKTSGVGHIVEATILGKSKHQIDETGSQHKKFQYICIHLSICKAMKRKFDTKGEEIEPDFGTSKKVNTGYLMSSYKNVSKEGEDVVSPSDLKSILYSKELEEILDGKLQIYNHSNYVAAVWCEQKQLEGVELPVGVKVRLRTKGNGCYLESIICLDEETTTKVNYSSNKPVGGSWTDKVLNTKDEKAPGSHLTKESQGVDDDEWDD